ncbi:MAG: glycosyltransferase family 4 protein [Thermoplasmata archaeon]|nr:glycosyltransferase family 4 protein [Thermoplasmata archaeon]
MKVCLLAPEFLPNQGGVGSYCVELARQLASRVDLTVVTLVRRKGAETFDREAMEAYFDHRLRVQTLSEAHDSFLYNAGFQWALLRRLPELFRSESFDVVHSQHAHMPDLLSGQFLDGPPTVRTIHTTIRGQKEAIHLASRLGGALEPSERWQIALDPLLRAAEWMTLRRRDHYITVSEWMRGELVRGGFPPERLGVVYNGVDQERFHPGASGPGTIPRKNGGPVVLFSGRPTRVKGAAVLAEAIPRVLREVPRAEFAFTGAGGSEILELMGKGFAPSEKLHFLGYVPYDQLPAVYASADVAVAPTFYDNFPIRIVELLSSGVPVVASEVGGIPEVVIPDRSGILVPPGSAELLAEGIIRLLRDEGLRRRLSEGGRALVLERFSWRHAADQTVAVYRAAAGS